MRTKYLCVLMNFRIRGKVGTVQQDKPSSNLITDRFKLVILLWIIFVIMYHVCLYYPALSVPGSLVVNC